MKIITQMGNEITITKQSKISRLYECCSHALVIDGKRVTDFYLNMGVYTPALTRIQKQLENAIANASEHDTLNIFDAVEVAA